jgi:organic hydroperoxide reductase OsmC/OhrA
MDLKPREYKYETSLTWTGEHKGDIVSPDKPVVKVACPPEWGGHEGIWSPEDLFVGSVELCTMTTFLYLLDKNKMKILSYKSSAVGIAKMVSGSFIFSEVVVEPEVEISDSEHTSRIKELFEECRRGCLIANSVKSDVQIKPKVIVKS